MYAEWVRRSPCYAVKCVLLLQLISRTTGAGCSVDHGSGMNYPTTTASGTWTTRGGISSYGWDSRQPIDPCSRCTNVPPPLPGSQFTTSIHGSGYSSNDRISTGGHHTDNRVAGGYGSDNRGSAAYGSDNRITGYGSDNRGNGYNPGNRGNNYHTSGRPNEYNPNGPISNGYNSGGGNHVTDNRVNVFGGYNADNHMRNPDYRGNGYDNLSPEWERRHNNKKGSGGNGAGGMGSMSGHGGGGISGYYQGTSYPVPINHDGQGAHVQGNYYMPSNDRWGMKGAYPVKIEPGYWQSQPPKDIGWDEDSKKVGVIAGWIGGPKKYESTSKPSQGSYGSNEASDKDDYYFNKGTGYDNSSDRKKPYMGWGGSGSYEVIKMNNGYKYVDRNGNSDYGTNYGNNYGYGGQSHNDKPSQDYGSRPMNVGHSRPNGHGSLNYDKPSQNYDKPTHDYGNNGPMHGHDKPIHDYGNNGPMHGHDKPVHDYGNNGPMHGHDKPTHEYGNNAPTHGYSKPVTMSSLDYGSSPSMGWSTPRPIGFEVTSSRPPSWGSQKPGYQAIASRPTQHWGENSFSQQLGSGGGGGGGGGGSGSLGYGRPDGGHDHNSVRPDDYGSLRPNRYGSSRPNDYGSSMSGGYGSSMSGNFGSSRPGGYGSSGPDDYGSSGPGTGGRPGGHGSSRPYVGSMYHGSGSGSDYDSQRPDFDKFGGFSENGGSSGDGGRPQMHNRPGYDNERPFMNGNDVYGSQQQTGSGYGKGYASNWDYHSSSMRPLPAGGWNDPQRDYLQRRPDGDVLQSGSNFRPSESTPLHYNGHSGIGASTDNGFVYRNPSTIGSSTTPMPSTDS